VEVPDGSCESSTSFGPASGHVYLLDYTYRDHQSCELRCYEQIPSGAPGEFRNQSCPVVVAPRE
jgi:hypothetical protein